MKKIIDEEFGGLQAQKADVVEDLHEKKFRPFPKLAKAKSAGETEDAEDGANDDVEEAATGTSTRTHSDSDLEHGPRPLP